jgi:hypothetical protein
MKEKLDHLWGILTRTELWVTVFAVAGVLSKVDMLPDGMAKVVALVAAVGAALGYTGARTLKKIGVAKAKAEAVASGNLTPDP